MHSQCVVLDPKFSSYMDLVPFTIPSVPMSSSDNQVSVHYRDTSFVYKNVSNPVTDSPDCTSSPLIEKPVEAIIISILWASVKHTHPMVTISKLGVVKANPRYALVGTADNVLEPTYEKKALEHSGRLQAVQEKLQALEEN